MDKTKVLEIIELFKNSLYTQQIHPSKIILFGSYANNTYHEASDIDLVVVSDDFENKSLYERMIVLARAIQQVFEPIEAIPATPKEWDDDASMIIKIAKSGEIVYSRN